MDKKWMNQYAKTNWEWIEHLTISTLFKVNESRYKEFGVTPHI